MYGQGVTTAGSKRVRCELCGKSITLAPKWRGPLTSSEIHCIYLDCVAGGLTYRACALRRGISIQCVANYARRIRKALGLS